MKLRTLGISAVAALALVAGPARAQEAAAAGGGWDTKYGILFTLPNPFGGASGTNVVNGYDGLVGFQYNLGPQAALRIGADLVTDYCGRTEATNAAGVTTKTVCTRIGGTYGGYNSELGVTLTAEYLMRASTAAVSPYFGVGAALMADRKGLSGTNEVSGSTIKTEYKNSELNLALGVGAKAGLEWRVHKVIAIFAEYQAGLTLIDRVSYKTDVQTTGSPATKTDGNRSDFFNLSTGIAHGGQLGLVAFF